MTQDATPANSFWLANLTRPLLENSQVAGTFGRHIPRPNCNPSLRRQITEEWAQQGGLSKIVKKVANQEELEKNKPFLVYFSNTSSCLRRAVWEEVPFPESSFGEDAALIPEGIAKYLSLQENLRRK